MSLPSGLDRALGDLAARGQILVCCDYDGTLAPIVADPQKAFPEPGARGALLRLLDCPGVSVAVVSGRAVVDLKRLSGLPQDVAMVGSHGAEFEEGVFPGLGPAERDLLDRLVGAASDIVADVPGAAVEVKPVSVAVHVRRAGRPDADRVLARVDEQLIVPNSQDAGSPQVFVTHGKEVVELAVLHADKGDAVEALLAATGSQAALFVGDDVTDERAFAKLRPADVGVKVGSGDSLAAHRVASPAEVLDMLERLAQLRGCDTEPEG